MSTWDDKPNDYEHALAEIERLQAELDNGDETLGRYVLENGMLEAEIAQLRADFNDCNFTREALKLQVIKLRAALEEIASHLIDSELASREKRGMARKALAQ